MELNGVNTIREKAVSSCAYDTFGGQANTSKEKWLAVAFSWMLPGLGQVYCEYFIRGIFYFFLSCILFIIGIGGIVSCSFNIWVALSMRLFSVLILPVLVCVDAYRLARKREHDVSSQQPNMKKDAWLAVFLSLLLPGLGHAYLLKGALCFLFICCFLVLLVLSVTSFIALLCLVFFRILVIIHVYIITPMNYKKNFIIPFAIFVLLVLSISSIFIPWFVQSHITMAGTVHGSHSMAPTLKAHDRMIINRLKYIWENPQIGDIVVFSNPDAASSAEISTEKLVKRVIATGGDIVQIKDEKIYINGQESSYIISNHSDNWLNYREYQSEFGKGSALSQHFGVDEPFEIPEAHYFVLGDNLKTSWDSRHFGPVPGKEIIGKVVKIYWPLGRMRTFSRNKSE